MLASNVTDGLKTSSVGPETTKTNDKDLHDLFSLNSNTSSLLNGNNSTMNGTDHLSPSGKNDTQSVMSTLAVSAMEGGGKVKFDDKIKATVDVHSTTPLSVPMEVDLENPNVGENSFNSENVTPITVPEKLEPSKKSSIVPRKGVGPQDTGKIVPRKGVNELSGEITDNSDISLSTEEKSKSIEDKTNCICCPNTTLNHKVGNESTNSCKMCCDEADKNVPLTKNVTNITPSNNSLPVSEASSPSASNNNNTLNSSSTNASKTTPTPTPPPIVRNKKPLITSDIPYDTSTNVSSNQQPVPEKNTQYKSDYVVPVVGIILALPLIIILVIVLYKKGSEFWERRHYRRMDYLIDEMYNE
ncbi:hypothetical protein C0J52_09657 [Blattella germanica]|nr:hypothetical protein C0J52_09657 [Blattella germanica]